MKIGIAIPVFESAKYIEECLDSIPNDSQIEIFCADDDSKDDSVDTIKEWQLRNHRRLKLKINESNLGATRNIARVMAEASEQTDLVLLLASDDKFGNFNVTKVIKNFAKKSKLVMSNHIILYFEHNEENIVKVYIPPNISWLGKYSLCLLLTINILSAPGSVFRSSNFQGRFLGTANNYTQDWCLGMHMAITGTIGTESAGYFLYRQHENNLSKKSSAMTAHLEWSMFVKELFGQPEFFDFCQKMKPRQRKFFLWFYRFLSWEKPYCEHLDEIDVRLQKALELNEVSHREVTEECRFLGNTLRQNDEKSLRDKLQLRSIVLIVKSNSLFLRKTLILVSSILFFAKRIIKNYISITKDRLRSH